MKIKLPSLGVLGCSEVDMEIPRYKHIRQISQQFHHPDVVGYHLLQLLLADPTDLDRMTFQDKNYLTVIAVASMHMNVISMKVTCSCGERLTEKYDLSQQELITLEEGTPKVLVKQINGVDYKYQHISATDEFKLCNWALEKAESSGKDVEKEYARSYEEGFICLTFGQPLTQEGLNTVASYELVVYYSALLFREMLFHGVRPVVQTQCPKCQRPLNVIVPFEKTLCDWSSTDVVREFTSVAKLVGGFSSFLDLTFSEVAQIQRDQEAAEQQ